MSFHFEFCPFSFLSGLKGGGGGNDTTSHFTIFSAVGGGICAWEWDLCRGIDLCSVFLFLAWLFYPYPVFVLENNGVMSHFLTS